MAATAAATEELPAEKPAQKKKQASKRIARETVVLPSGQTAVVKTQPKSRKRESDDDVPGTFSYFVGILSQPKSYRLFDHVPREPGQYGGHPRDWPNELMGAAFDSVTYS
ncbi:MAG: hypothetical protein WCI74_21290 [Actinomycetes bacterium]